MLNLSKKASTFVYILLLLNVAIIMGVVIFNNGFVLNNNINIGKNAEEVFTSVHNKGNIAIESVKKYNKNGFGFIDFISCPTNVTMSGSTFSGSAISTTMVLDKGSIYCRGYYEPGSKEFRIYYNSDYSDFIKVYYNWVSGSDIVDLDSPLDVSTSNLLEETGVDVTTPDGIGDSTALADNNEGTVFETSQGKDSSVLVELDRVYNIGKLRFTKPAHANAANGYWDSATLYFYDDTYDAVDSEISFSTLKNMRPETEWESPESMFVLGVKYIKFELNTGNQLLDISDLYVYEKLANTGGLDFVVGEPTAYEWVGERVYTDSDSTLVSFDATGVGVGDGIDDNFNSDDYSVMSSARFSQYYFPGFQDDDVVPRKTVFGSIPAGEFFDNIYWTNYKTLEFIENNPNNADNVNVTASGITDGYMYLDITFENDEVNKSFDLKILEFDRNKWKNEFTLFPLGTLSGDNLANTFGYISQTSTGALFLSPNTGSGYSFDFQNRDYALFLTNYADTSLSYRLTGETTTGTGIYINAIDDSDNDVIRVLANDIIIGGEKNFIGEEFIIIGEK